MSFSDRDVQLAEYLPEKLPYAEVVNAPLSSIVTPSLIDVRRLTTKWISFDDFSGEQTVPPGQAILQVENDKNRFDINTIGFKNQKFTDFRVIGTNFVKVNLFNDGGFANFNTLFAITVFRPTIADKLLNNKPLTNDEENIAEQLNVREEVKRGVLPVPLNTRIQREYQLINGKRTFTYPDEGVTSTERTIQTIEANADEIIILESVSATTAGAIADDIRLRVDRDNEADYVDLHLSAYNWTNDINQKMFVPALNELRFKVLATTAGVATTATIRYTVARYKLTDILRVRFGLVTIDEVPTQTWNRVKAGLL